MTTEGTPRGDGGIATALRVDVPLWLAVLFMAVAFGAGVIVHAMAAPQTATPVVAGSGGTDPSAIFAPPLSEDQLDAGLPTGHPDIGQNDGTGTEDTKDDAGEDTKGDVGEDTKGDAGDDASP